MIRTAVLLLLALCAPAGAADKPFRDCPECPQMIVLPGGTFMMGSPESETADLKVPDALAAREHPAHQVKVGRFAIGVYEVTVGEYAAFMKASGHHDPGNCYSRDAAGTRKYIAEANWRNPGPAQTDKHPVICIGWPDAKAYVAWLSQRTGKAYRLLTEAEWEYAARAGTTTPWFWGTDRNAACAWGNMPNAASDAASNPAATDFACQDGIAEIAPVGSFKPNTFGLHDMLGNVWEWVEDCMHPSYDGAPTDGSAWVDDPACNVHGVRGGGWVASQTLPRAAARSSDPLPYRGIGLGLRIARTMDR